ncbi:hypothetical protein [Streptomyces sp. NBC_01685]|uniref:hypothetical protein n=1 Tax=Streptomyces sp. NBC_01685 TaxID=2975910 RepID=UPI002E2FB6A3|nr:hypothetical protein [Streptomyces sp. NBC_01685]
MPRVVVFDRTGAPDVLHLVDEPLDEPGNGEVRIRIEAAGVNRLDQMMRAGHLRRIHHRAGRIRRPAARRP